MSVFSILTIYSIVKKYVTINNKENIASILLLNIFLYTKSDFIGFDFTMKSLPITGFYFRWRMLGDSLTFQLSSLAPLPKNGFCGRNFKNLSPDSKSGSLRYYVHQLSDKTNNFEFLGPNLPKNGFCGRNFKNLSLDLESTPQYTMFPIFSHNG